MRLTVLAILGVVLLLGLAVYGFGLLQSRQYQETPGDWTRYENTNVGFSLAYPGDPTTTFLEQDVILPTSDGGNQRHMRVSISDTPSDCSGDLVTVNTTTFCKTVADDPAIGSTARTYKYTTEKRDSTISVKFTIRYPTDTQFDETSDTALFDEILRTWTPD